MNGSRPFDPTPKLDAPTEVEQLRTLLYTDDLTGLFNRRFFRHCIEEQKLHSEKTGEPFALLIMDIDHFKQINDSYGHAVGDAALIRVAQALKDQIEQGWVFRYAGDEFVALLRNCPEEEARAACGRILVCISTALADRPSDLPLKTISLSIGFAIFPEDSNRISALFQAADHALYASKQSGRNCFHSVRELATSRKAAPEWPIHIHFEALIGRQQQWALLQHHFSQCQAGRGRLLFVTGEAGIGKSRLLHQFVRRQRAADYHILYGECTEGTTIHSFVPVRDALKKGFEAQDPATVNLFRQLEPHCRRELIELVPQFDRFEKELLPSGKSPDRYLLLESILMLLQAISRQLPTVMVLEDIHWGDEATLNLLQYLARNIRNERILMIATFREEDAIHSQLPAILHNMSRENLFETISLKPLSAEETALMVEELFAGYTTYLSFKQWIHEETEGIPFYVEELIKLLLEEGYIQRVGTEIEARRPDKFLLPYSIRALIQRRINRLSESLQRVLGFASIIGYEFDLQILVRLIEENEGYLLDLLEQLMKLELIREVAEAGAERFRFRHNKIRDVIYEGMGLIKRRKFHRRVGEILESIHADELELYAEELEHHFEEGGVMKKAFLYSLEAGKKALQIHAYQDAEAHFDHCFQYGELMDTSGMELVADLYSSKAATMEALGSWEEAIRCYWQLLSLRKAAASRVQQVAALNHLSRVYYMKEDFLNSQESAQQALELARETNDSEGACTASYNLGKYYWRMCEYDAALECMKTAAQIAEQLADSALEGKYLNSAGIVYL
ncbi:MAG TPA: diguanylate cyclase, partial [Acidobacteriota bacterium]|nr:diguanylate cyclase [Acidobacteriota bacterium]